jgi:hypothetical protein
LVGRAHEVRRDEDDEFGLVGLVGVHPDREIVDPADPETGGLRLRRAAFATRVDLGAALGLLRAAPVSGIGGRSTTAREDGGNLNPDSPDESNVW